MALAAASRVHSTPRAATYRPSNPHVRFSHRQASKPNKTHKAPFLEQRTEKAAFQEIKKEQALSRPDLARDKYAHYEGPKIIKPDRYPNLQFIGAAPEELDDETCRQSWELNREIEKRIIKKPK